MQILDFVPRIVDERGKDRLPSELKQIEFESPSIASVYLAVLNSSLFYWLLSTYSDCRNLNKREVFGVPFDYGRASDDVLDRLERLAHNLMGEFKSNSQMLEMNYQKHGRLRIQCIYPRMSKETIDAIDRVLAEYGGFDPNATDFLINYDIKYRMPGNNDDD